MNVRLFTAIAMITALSLSQAGAQSAWRKVAEKLRPNSIEEHQGGLAEVPEEPAAEASADGPQVAALENDSGAAPNDRVGMMHMEEGRSGRAKMNLGREFEEEGNVPNLFDDPDVLRMLGENPRFVYNANNKPDPMVFPPVRNAAIYAERKALAEAAEEEGRYEDAIEHYMAILKLRDRRFLAEARTAVSELNARIGAQMAMIEGDDVQAELPHWVRDNTRMVLHDPKQPMCLVGDFMLKVGDNVPNYPEVTVASVSAEKVVFKVSGQKFEVEVKGFYGE